MNIWRKFLAFASAFALSSSAMAGGTGPTVVQPFMWTNNGALATPSQSFVSDQDTGIYSELPNRLGIVSGGLQILSIRSNAVVTNNTGSYTWTDGTAGGNIDLVLTRDVANVLAQRNGVNNQAFRIYGTYTDASNNEALGLSASTTSGFITTRRAGTGAARDLQLGTDNTARWFIGATSGHFLAQVDDTYDIGAAAANRPRSINISNSLVAGSVVAAQQLWITDGIAAPTATAGRAKIFVDTADGDYKVIFGDGVIQTIARDTNPGTISTNGFTVGTLPTCNAGAAGTQAHVTDAAAPAFLVALVGGGAIVSPAFCNGTAWVAG